MASNSEQSKGILKTLQELVDKVGKQNGRVGKLEKLYWTIIGGVGVVGGLFAMVSLIVSWTKH